ncbi:Nif3-like dinuclear metal center hexameric protein [Gracilibacillus kekensis]|uniref:GTP cyclohydrolase 1 type 2 homolog n=1 Tax=Gracilibacillus kekensis TaxID=1027249 RepID=A0A1M7N6K3_9BACI|nr:Nif3-like dinuclear metal center hexameric protein [Gracilibacillus kekensis]SHM98670.1 Putative GTP cyclohydrolase 1 type 2, NIF3 family [Gracilibacillus kekensis]
MTTVQQVIDKLKEGIAPVEETVDTVKFGDSSQKVKKIAVAFMPTYDVIKKVINLEVNLLICHEGTFYRHHDGESLMSDIHKQKIKLIEDSGIVISRFHDYIHRYRPDGIMQGMIAELGWQSFVEKHLPSYSTFNIPKQSLLQVIQRIKKCLQLNHIRYVGDLSENISKAAVFVGFRGSGANTIPVLEEENADLVIYGEGPEWETPEFVRDALAMGHNKAAIILGHLESEEPGMKYLSESIAKLYPSIPVVFLPTENCIKTL